ncbi:MAG: ECF transporter S component [Spirochaetes bacterium]|nr:ECF transporter S component [Spirochaetota bacterium]
MEQIKNWTLRELVVAAAIGVVFGFLYLAWVQLWLVLRGLIGPLSMDIVFGFWFAGSTVAAYVIRKPWAALGVSMAAVVTEILAGSPAGAILLLTGLVQGLGSEVPFLVTRWKRYTLPVLLLSGGCASVFSFVYTWFRFSYWTLAPGLLVAMFVLRVSSGVLLGGFLGKVIADAVKRTGVFRGLAMDPVEP